jgi:hypothetical protein
VGEKFLTHRNSFGRPIPTTSFGFLGGLGIEYITNQVGPDEGLKPAAFLGVVVQVGQANPSISGSAKANFGSAVGGP